MQIDFSNEKFPKSMLAPARYEQLKIPVLNWLVMDREELWKTSSMRKTICPR